MTTQIQIQGLGEFAQQGFALGHPNDHILELRHEGELIARFNQTKVTEENLQEEAAQHLVSKHGWDGCLWNRNKKD